MNKEPHVALIRPRTKNVDAEFCDPLGLFYLKGALVQAGIHCRIFDRRLLDRQQTDFREAIEAYDPELIALSIMAEDEVPDGLNIIHHLRNGRRRFVVGGLYVTTDCQTARIVLPRDADILPGEGEKTLVDYVRGKKSDHREFQTLHPDKWPVPDRQDFWDYLTAYPVISLRTSRGCPGKCRFCGTPGLPFELCHYAERSLDKVVDEIEMLAEDAKALGKLPVFNIIDDHFGSIERLDAFTECLKNRALKIAFALQLRAVDLYKAEGLAKRLKEYHESGLCRIFIGLESLNPKALKQWQKVLDPECTLDAMDTVRNSGIECVPGYILWHQDTDEKTIYSEVEMLHRRGWFNPKIALSRMIYFPGTALGGTGRRRLAPLGSRLSGFYETIYSKLSDIRDLWIAGSALLAGEGCASHLTGKPECLHQLQMLLDKINAECYRVFMNKNACVSEAFVKEGKVALDEIRRSTLSS